MNSLTLIILVLLAIIVVTTTIALVFGGPIERPPLSSINNPYKIIDYSDLPAVSHFVARDGMKLTFRAYSAMGNSAKGSVVLVHGSAAAGISMHAMAKAFAQAGYTAYTLDIRGHGGSGNRGRIAYVGQLEDDLEDFISSVNPDKPTTLAGFSSGGGFALRFAGSSRQKLFSSYLLLSPFISQIAPTYRPNGGGWVSVGYPRFATVIALNAIGIRAFNDLPLIKFALIEDFKAILTPEYTFALAQNFRPKHNYRANIRSVNQPFRVVAGKDDEVFYADRFAKVFRAKGKDVPITLISGIGHVPITTEHTAVQAAIAAVHTMNEPRG